VLTTTIKRLIYPLFIYPKITKGVQRKLHNLFDSYAISKSVVPADIKPIKVFSSFEEDGIIIWLMALLGIRKGYFLDIGSNDCINSNCANLVFNFGWDGLFIDADAKLLKIGKRNYALFGKTKRHQLSFVPSFVSPSNVNDLVEKNIATKDVDFMNLDIDSDDFLVWQTLTVVQPKVLVVENRIEYGGYDLVVPASADFSTEEWGASIVSMNNLAETKGYSLVAVNSMGFNAFFMRKDLLKKVEGLQPLLLPEVLKRPAIQKDFYSDDMMKSIIEKVKHTSPKKTV
jgi:hypothetical protein